MSNKKIFKDIYSKKINKDSNYRAILEKIENNNSKRNILKKVLVPVSSISLVAFLIIININENTNTLKKCNQIEDNSNQIYLDDSINLNSNTNEAYTSSATSVIKKENITFEELLKQSNYTFLSNLNIPSDLNNQTYQKVSLKNNNQKDYSILQNYEIIYQNNNDRVVVLSISDKYQFIRKYSSFDNQKNIKINNIEITIYQYEFTYTTTFIYNDINFDIKTSNITEEELTDLLTSIIK